MRKKHQDNEPCRSESGYVVSENLFFYQQLKFF